MITPIPGQFGVTHGHLALRLLEANMRLTDKTDRKTKHRLSVDGFTLDTDRSRWRPSATAQTCTFIF